MIVSDKSNSIPISQTHQGATSVANQSGENSPSFALPAPPAPADREAQKRSWMGIAAKIITGAMLRFLLFGAGLGFAGLILAAMMFHGAVAAAVEWPAGLETALVILAYLVYPLAGAFGGLVLAACRTVVVHLDDIEQQIHEMTEPIIAELARRLPKGDARLTMPEFEKLVDEVIRDWSRYNKPKWRVLSPLAWLAAGVRRVALIALRWTLVHDFIEVHEKRKMAHVTVGSLMTWGRERAVNRVTGAYRTIALILRVITGAILFAIWFGPAIAVWLF